MKIKTNTPVEVITVPEQKTTFDELEVYEIIDNPREKTVTVIVSGFALLLDCFSNENYDNNEWTNQCIIDAVKSYFNIE